jgi:hypothetical protein
MTLSAKTTLALERASRAVSRKAPQFVDVFRANIELVTALNSELTTLRDTWATIFANRASKSDPDSSGDIDQRIAIIQSTDLVTWVRVNRQMMERICEEIASLNFLWALGIQDFSTSLHGHQTAAGGGTLDVAAITTGILGLARGGTAVDFSGGGLNSKLIRMNAAGTALENSGSTVADFAAAAYTPAVPDDWEDSDPTTVVGALDRAAGGHAGVCLISAVEPTTPGNGQVWLDTAATGSGGSGVLTVDTITADATLTASQTVILCDASTGAITVTLPAASANAGRRYFVKKIDSSVFTVTIDGNAFETVDGDLTGTLTLQYEAVLIVCDGSNWHVL